MAADNERALDPYRHLGFIEEWRDTKLDPFLGTTLKKFGLAKLL